MYYLFRTHQKDTDEFRGEGIVDKPLAVSENLNKLKAYGDTLIERELQSGKIIHVTYHWEFRGMTNTYSRSCDTKDHTIFVYRIQMIRYLRDDIAILTDAPLQILNNIYNLIEKQNMQPQTLIRVIRDILNKYRNSASIQFKESDNE